MCIVVYKFFLFPPFGYLTIWTVDETIDGRELSDDNILIAERCMMWRIRGGENERESIQSMERVAPGII